MLLQPGSPLTDRPQFLGQSVAQHLAARLRPQAPLISIATFAPEPSTATQQSTWTQQLVRPGYNAAAGAVSPPAVSSNVQVLRSGFRPGGRVPAERRYRRKPKLRVAVDVDEGEHFAELFPVVMGLWVGKARYISPKRVRLQLNPVVTWNALPCSAGPLPAQPQQILPGGVWPAL